MAKPPARRNWFLRWWDRYGQALDHSGRAKAILDGLARIGPILVYVGIAWSFAKGWLGSLDPFATLAIVVGAVLLGVAVAGKLTLFVRTRLAKNKLETLVVLPTINPTCIYLRVTNMEEHDEFKANLTWIGHEQASSHVPILLRWKDVEGEYREIPRTDTEALHLLDYTIDRPSNDECPVLRYTVQAVGSPGVFAEHPLDDWDNWS